MKKEIKFQIRKGTFETNSSSTHVLCMCSSEEFKKFEKGEYVFDRYSDNFIPKESIDENDDDADYRYLDWDEFWDLDYETFSDEYTTKHGDKVVAFGYYGYD